MRVKVFDESHERDLENKVNMFLTTIQCKNIVDIKFSVSNSILVMNRYIVLVVWLYMRSRYEKNSFVEGSLLQHLQL